MKNAAIYVRVSTEKQVHGYSIDAQKSNLINFAKKNNFIIYDIYSDEGISAKNIIDRPEVKRLISDIESNNIDVLLIQKFDRLTRNISDTDEFIKLFQKFDIDVWSISDGALDVESSNGKFMTLLKGLFAQHERELTSERIKVAFTEKAKQGYSLCSSCPPFGYKKIKGDKILKIYNPEAKIVKRIFYMYINNNTLTYIAKMLNEEKIPTKKKNSIWTSKTIKNILNNPVYIGKIKHKNYIGKGLHKPIIDINVWNITQNRISKLKTKIKTNYPKEDVYYCGTLICNTCKKRLTTYRTISKLSKNGSRKIFSGYRCPNRELGLCNAPSISHKKMEIIFIEYLKNIDKLDTINDLIIPNKNYIEEINNIKKIIINTKSKIKSITNLFILDKIDYINYNTLEKDLNNSINKYKNKLAELTIKSQTPINKMNISPNIIDHWNYLTNKEKLDFLTNFIDYITISNIDKIPQIINIKFYS